MITVQPPQQQLSFFHLAMAVFLLFLTVYPYLFNGHNICCSVAAYSADDMDLRHQLISEFDIITTTDIVWSTPRSTRDTKGHLLNEQISDQPDLLSLREHVYTDNTRTKRVQFTSLGKKFNLILRDSPNLVTEDFTIVSLDAEGRETHVPFNRQGMQIFRGFIDGDSGSAATVAFNDQDKLLTAQINSGRETIIVEPTYLHKANLWLASPSSSTHGESSISNSKLIDQTMIVYNLLNHEQFNTNQSNGGKLFDATKLCTAVDLTSSSNRSAQSITEVESFQESFNKHAKRGIEYLTEQTRDKTRCTLHLVADYPFYKNVGNGDLQTTINYLLALINRVNQIYLPTVWETGDVKRETLTNIGFTVQNITIHQEYTRLSSGDIHYNMQGDKVWAAREFLDNFSKHSPPRHYCLAHLLTYRQFDSPVLGLAYVASTRFGTIGGICSPTQQKDNAFYKHNTGISTSKGISGETLITRQADLVLAHELGHNLGAEHDSNDCRPGPSNGGAYLMHPFAVMGFEKNNRFLSNCSRLSIGRVIKKKAPTCFVGIVDHVCGNGVVEDDEECDGGDIGHDHTDPCCDSSCRFTPGSQCSDRHSWCCSKCRIQPAGFSCRPAEEFNCKQASYCDGRSAECPASPPVDDNKVCVGRGLCRGGECIPFCEARELFSCLCNTPTDACKLCCKSSINGTCVPYDSKAPYLPDGVLCFRGVCEKGRCEQPIQDVVERLWDVIEDLNFTTFVKFLRDNIIFVVLVCSIPLWLIAVHYINEFDKRVKEEVMKAMKKSSQRKRPISASPFLPRLFVGDEVSSINSADDSTNFAEL